jgi:1-deoxy-D-xylulose-5-phosphate reductoisomerase
MSPSGATAIDPHSPAGRALAWPGRPWPRRVAILGSTGTVGLGGLAVVRQHGDQFEVAALAAGRRVRELAAQIEEFRPGTVVVADDRARAELASLVDLPLERIAVGEAGLEEIASQPYDVVLQAVAGAAGLPATLGAIAAGNPLALANKESLVLAGELVAARARDTGTPILPVDSEHAGLFQCLAGAAAGAVLAQLTLTASGGPLRARADWENATPEDVLAHPVWKMGERITVDSALLLNKGFEVIEARWLFGVPLSAIDVVVHPQAIVHALLTFVDHSTIAQLSVPDMKLPIQLALSWPARLPAPVPALDLGRTGRLDFEPLAPGRFPCFDLAREAARRGGTAPAILNAADEIAVGAFLDRRVKLGDVPGLLAGVLDAVPVAPATDLEAIRSADRAARDEAEAALARHARVRPGARARA